LCIAQRHQRKNPLASGFFCACHSMQVRGLVPSWHYSSATNASPLCAGGISFPAPDARGHCADFHEIRGAKRHADPSVIRKGL
ncbi:hypothetical protein ACYTTR_08360, partial [Cobetia marina]